MFTLFGRLFTGACLLPLFCSWSACSFARPPWADKLLSNLDATVRIVKKLPSEGPNTLQMWQKEGFVARHHHLVKVGTTCDVQTMDGTVVYVLMYSMYQGELIDNCSKPVKGKAIEPDLKVIEAWSIVDEKAGYQKSIAALVWLNSFLKKHLMKPLEPLVDKRKVLRRNI